MTFRPSCQETWSIRETKCLQTVVRRSENALHRKGLNSRKPVGFEMAEVATVRSNRHKWAEPNWFMKRPADARRGWASDLKNYCRYNACGMAGTSGRRTVRRSSMFETDPSKARAVKRPGLFCKTGRGVRTAAPSLYRSPPPCSDPPSFHLREGLGRAVPTGIAVLILSQDWPSIDGKPKSVGR